jgi:hypothetical protein
LSPLRKRRVHSFAPAAVTLDSSGIILDARFRGHDR